MKTAIIAGLIVITSISATAGTWHVEKDGSSDYTVIQDAVNASADGDTIRIGPGRYDDYQRYNIGAWEDRIIHVLLDGRSLTIIGDGEGNTIIGPTVEFDRTLKDMGIVVINGAVLSISDLTIERHYVGLFSWNNTYIEAVNCTFQHHTWGEGAAVFSGGGLFERCTFTGYRTGLFSGEGSVGVSVVNCTYQSVITGISTADAQDLLVDGCTINSTIVGVLLWQGTHATISNTNVVSGGEGVVVERGATSVVNDCDISGGSMSLWVNSVSTLTGDGNILRYGNNAVIVLQRSNISLTNSHIIAGSGHAVECSYSVPGEDWTVDFRNNWWGVSDSESIDALIWDGNDDPEILAVVDCQPFKDGPTPNESKSWSDVKAMFR